MAIDYGSLNIEKLGKNELSKYIRNIAATLNARKKTVSKLTDLEKVFVKNEGSIMLMEGLDDEYFTKSGNLKSGFADKSVTEMRDILEEYYNILESSKSPVTQARRSVSEVVSALNDGSDLNSNLASSLAANINKPEIQKELSKLVTKVAFKNFKDQYMDETLEYDHDLASHAGYVYNKTESADMRSLLERMGVKLEGV